MPKLLAKEIFDSTGEFANADVVTAFEDLEKKRRLLIRYTKDGNDWVALTPEGLAEAGITQIEADLPGALAASAKEYYVAKASRG